MAEPWLHVIGLGAEGMSSLSPAARAALEAAEVIVGGARHHALTEGHAAERIGWPSPFDAGAALSGLRGRRVAVLVTGDPLWFSAGESIAGAFDPAEVAFYPQVSAFQLAATRMGWPLTEVETLSAHGRAAEAILPSVVPGARLLVLTSGSESPAQIAQLLTQAGFGPSRIVALSDMGTANERRVEGLAQEWHHEVPALNTLAITCQAAPGARVLGRAPGLPDEAFAHDGTMTKRDIRAMTLARLRPMPGALLWDIGCGAGSVAIEWMRASKGARAIGIEPRPGRRASAAANAQALGTPGLVLVEGEAPEALDGLPAPDAVFIGGGLTHEAFAAAWGALGSGGRLVANAVTLDSQTLLCELGQVHGGELVSIALARAEPIGARVAWRPAMPVVQLSLVKP